MITTKDNFQLEKNKEFLEDEYKNLLFAPYNVGMYKHVYWHWKSKNFI